MARGNEAIIQDIEFKNIYPFAFVCGANEKELRGFFSTPMSAENVHIYGQNMCTYRYLCQVLHIYGTYSYLSRKTENLLPTPHSNLDQSERVDDIYCHSKKMDY